MSRAPITVKDQEYSQWRPTAWRLWTLGPRAVVALLLIDLAGIAATATALLHSAAPQARHWWLFAGLCGAGFLHVLYTGPGEERRRGDRLRRRKAEFVDLTSIWFAAGALVLPASLAVALMAVVWGRVYLIARKPPAVWISTTCMILLSVVGVSVVPRLIGGSIWAPGPIVLGSTSALSTSLVMLAAVAVYFLAQAVPAGLYRGVRYGRWTLRETLGSLEDNVLIVVTLCVAMGAALVATAAPYALPGVLFFAVWLTRNSSRISALVAEQAQLKVAAFTDLLTKLLNRGGFESLARAALDVDQSAGQPTSVLMLDIDHFKEWNTLLGHFGADVVLQKVAETVRSQTRQGDIVARWGGEEITAVLPGTDLSGALVVAERIRAAVHQLDTAITRPAGGETVRLGKAGLRPCTISIGVATAPGHGTTVATVQEAADTALQQAKDNGRNQVWPAPSERVFTKRSQASPVGEDRWAARENQTEIA